MKTLQTDYGHIVVGDNALGKGGRGSVFPLEHASHPLAGLDADQLVFKRIEARHRTAGRKGKVGLMIGLHARGTIDRVNAAWPLANAYEEGEWVGYVMRRANGCPLDEVKSNASIAFSDKVRAAERMCRLVHDMHSLGIVIGDVNLANFLHDEETDELTLIDLDSAQVANEAQGTAYPTTESRAKSPEMLNGHLGETLLTSRSDDYLLAVEVFRLLFDVHPLDEYDANASPDEVRLGNTRNRRFGFDYSDACCGTDAFGSHLARLFRASFEGPYDKLPSARDYAACLRELAEENDFETCPICGAWRKASPAPSGQTATPTPRTPANRGASLGTPSRKKRMKSRRATSLFRDALHPKSALRTLAPYVATGAIVGVLLSFGVFDPFEAMEALASEGANVAAAAEAECSSWINEAQVGIENLKQAAADAAQEMADKATSALHEAWEQAKTAALAFFDEAGQQLKAFWDDLWS